MFIPLITDVALLHHTCCLILSKQLFIYSYLCSVCKLALQILQTWTSWMHKQKCVSYKINHLPFPSPFLISYLITWWYLYCLHMNRGTDKTLSLWKSYWNSEEPIPTGSCCICMKECKVCFVRVQGQELILLPFIPSDLLQKKNTRKKNSSRVGLIPFDWINKGSF